MAIGEGQRERERARGGQQIRKKGERKNKIILTSGFRCW